MDWPDKQDLTHLPALGAAIMDSRVIFEETLNELHGMLGEAVAVSVVRAEPTFMLAHFRGVLHRGEETDSSLPIPDGPSSSSSACLSIQATVSSWPIRVHRGGLDYRRAAGAENRGRGGTPLRREGILKNPWHLRAPTRRSDNRRTRSRSLRRVNGLTG
jgi:hypothetical protein